MRTGSFGNRDAESLIKTLVEPKRTILSEIRKTLLSMGYSEDVGFDSINIESYVSYSYASELRFLCKHKWNLEVLVAFSNLCELEEALSKFPNLQETIPQDETFESKKWASLNPSTEMATFSELARLFSSKVD